MLSRAEVAKGVLESLAGQTEEGANKLEGGQRQSEKKEQKQEKKEEKEEEQEQEQTCKLLYEVSHPSVTGASVTDESC